MTRLSIAHKGITAASFLICFCAQPLLAKELRYSLVPGERQGVEYNQGTGTYWSETDTSEVELINLGSFTDKREEFLLTVWNIHGKSIEIDVTDVSAEYKATPLHVYTTTELKKIVKGRAGWSSFGVAVLGGVRAGLSYNTSTVSSYGRVGNSYYSSSSRIVTPNYAAQADAYADTQDMQDRIKDASNSALSAIEAGGLERTTLKDDLAHSWKIVIDKPARLDGTLMKVKVRVGDDVHVFDFKVEEKK